MRAALLREVGAPLELAEVPEPEARDGRTAMRVRAAGVNFLDVLIRRGTYPAMPELPAVLGAEVAGELPDGTRAMALTGGTGGFAETVLVDEALAVPLPESATFAEGASFLLTYLTVYIPLSRLPLGHGSTVLVLGAAGGVGTAALQVAQALGAEAVAAVGSDDKAEKLVGRAAHVHVYTSLPSDLRVDAVIDPVGGDMLPRALSLLKPLGTLVSIGFAAGDPSPVDVRLLVGRNVSLQGFYLGRLMRHEPAVVAAALRELVGLWHRGAVAPVVGAELALERANDALDLLESRQAVGKVVLVP